MTEQEFFTRLATSFAQMRQLPFPVYSWMVSEREGVAIELRASAASAEGDGGSMAVRVAVCAEAMPSLEEAELFWMPLEGGSQLAIERVDEAVEKLARTPEFARLMESAKAHDAEKAMRLIFEGYPALRGLDAFERAARRWRSDFGALRMEHGGQSCALLSREQMEKAWELNSGRGEDDSVWAMWAGGVWARAEALALSAATASPSRARPKAL